MQILRFGAAHLRAPGCALTALALLGLLQLWSCSEGPKPLLGDDWDATSPIADSDPMHARDAGPSAQGAGDLPERDGGDGSLVHPPVGDILGVVSDEVRVFRAIPYGRADRFAHAEAVQRLDQLPFRAVSDAPSCPQPDYDGLFGAAAIDEDCLRLNIWSPQGAVDLPVMVWIHGGGFKHGGINDPRLDGTVFARAGIVLVTLSYRVGAFGSLELSHLLGEGYEDSADLSIYDQIVALEWIRRNIRAFGGDPDNVTLFGESAGGSSIAHLLTTESALPLFARGILQSGALNLAHTQSYAREVTARFLRHAGLDPRDAAQLLTMRVEEIRKAEDALLADAQFDDLVFGPRVDGRLHKTPPMQALAAGIALGKDVIVGTTRDEMAGYTSEVAAFDLATPGIATLILPYFGTAVRGDAQKARTPYDQRLPNASASDVLVEMLSDAFFRIPAERFALTQAEGHGRAWFYRFDGPSSVRGTAPHAIEIPFLFDTYATRPELIPEPWPTHVGDTMRALWIAFASTGEPSVEGLPAWPQFGTDRKTLRIAESLEVMTNPRPEETAVWNGVPFDGLDPEITLDDAF